MEELAWIGFLAFIGKFFKSDQNLLQNTFHSTCIRFKFPPKVSTNRPESKHVVSNISGNEFSELRKLILSMVDFMPG